MNKVKKIREEYNIGLLEAKRIVEFQNLRDAISKMAKFYRIDSGLEKILNTMVDMMEGK